jgi:hypothetical protein
MDRLVAIAPAIGRIDEAAFIGLLDRGRRHSDRGRGGVGGGGKATFERSGGRLDETDDLGVDESRPGGPGSIFRCCDAVLVPRCEEKHFHDRRDFGVGAAARRDSQGSAGPSFDGRVGRAAEPFEGLQPVFECCAFSGSFCEVSQLVHPPLNSQTLNWIRGFILKFIKKAKFEGDKPLKWLGPSATSVSFEGDSNRRLERASQ